MTRDEYKTAGELSMELPFSEEYIREAMNHPDFDTMGVRPAFARLDDALDFFKSHPGYRARSIYSRRKRGLRTV